VQDSPVEFAVLVPIIEHGGKECVLLTKRPDTLDRYAGQVSLPGGAREPADQSLEETALREAAEEVGIRPEDVEIIREIDWHETALLHRVKPFVGRVRGSPPLAPDPREVERILFLPVERITPGLFRVRGSWTDPSGRERTTWTFDLEGFEVWGLTARILRAVFTDDP
jgi:8-oxo-dGTP pyrophosphatase MutT (NUDIX family)